VQAERWMFFEGFDLDTIDPGVPSLAVIAVGAQDYVDVDVRIFVWLTVNGGAGNDDTDDVFIEHLPVNENLARCLILRQS